METIKIKLVKDCKKATIVKILVNIESDKKTCEKWFIHSHVYIDSYLYIWRK